MTPDERAIAKDLTVEEFRRFRDHIQEHAGIYLEEQKLDSLRISIVTRATRLGVLAVDEYYDLLTESDEEFRELLNLITINETSFFRFPQQYEALKARVLPEILETKPSGNRALRVWSAGCSTGEEPYSIAMTIADLGIEGLGWQPQVMGTDVSTKALGVARRGVYREKTVANLAQDTLDRYFEAVDEGYRVRERIRNTVDFGYQNLIKEPYPLSLMGNWDVIFCRNVTIYFRLESTKRVVANFFSSLNEGGYLFIGHSETLSGISDDFEAMEIGGVFLYRKPRGRTRGALVGFDSSYERMKRVTGRTDAEKPEAEPGEDVRPEDESDTTVEERVELARELVGDGRHEEARILLEEAVELEPLNVDARLLAAFSRADAGEYSEALAECERALAINPLLAGARYVLGMIHLRRDDLTAAVSEFKKAVYLDSDFVLAHLNLANIYRRQSKWASACRSYENAIASLDRNTEGEWTEFMGGFTADLIRKTCERSLIECRKATEIA
jgi:chemotaxis protein methyltransferase CheR